MGLIAEEMELLQSGLLPEANFLIFPKQVSPLPSFPYQCVSSLGYSVEDWNALDWFITESVFVNCYTGITNIYGEGNVHGYQNQFFNSTLSDFSYGNCEYFSVRENFSYNSTRFILHGNGGCSLQLVVQQNIVVAPNLANNSGLIYIGMC